MEGIHDAYGLVWGDDNSDLRQTVEYGTRLVLGTGAFFINGKLGYAALAGLLALDQAKAHDTLDHQVEDMAIGAAKGLVIRGAVNYIFDQNWSNTRKALTGLASVGAISLISRPTFGSAESTASAHRPQSPTANDVSGFRSTQYVPRFNGQIR